VPAFPIFVWFPPRSLRWQDSHEHFSRHIDPTHAQPVEKFRRPAGLRPHLCIAVFLIWLKIPYTRAGSYSLISLKSCCRCCPDDKDIGSTHFTWIWVARVSPMPGSVMPQNRWAHERNTAKKRDYLYSHYHRLLDTHISVNGV